MGSHMRTKIFILALFFLTLIISCGKRDSDVDSRWRVSDKVDYNPQIDRKQLFTSVLELEKLLFAPLDYFEEHGEVFSYNQNISFLTQKFDEGKKRSLSLEEKSSYSRDKSGNFLLRYSNNHHQGWDMVWKDNFLYRKMLGGEYTKTFSMGEHSFYKESLFRMIPDLHAAFRGHASVKEHSDTLYKGKAVTVVTMNYDSKKRVLPALEDKKYLQNSFGVREMKNDELIRSFSKRDYSGVDGFIKLYITPENIVLKVEFELSFKVENEKVGFRVAGERELFNSPLDQIEVARPVPEYHRRTFDAAKNIMQGEKNGKKDRH